MSWISKELKTLRPGGTSLVPKGSSKQAPWRLTRGSRAGTPQLLSLSVNPGTEAINTRKWLWRKWGALVSSGWGLSTGLQQLLSEQKPNPFSAMEGRERQTRVDLARVP